MNRSDSPKIKNLINPADNDNLATITVPPKVVPQVQTPPPPPSPAPASPSHSITPGPTGG